MWNYSTVSLSPGRLQASPRSDSFMISVISENYYIILLIILLTGYIRGETAAGGLNPQYSLTRLKPWKNTNKPLNLKETVKGDIIK